MRKITIKIDDGPTLEIGYPDPVKRETVLGGNEQAVLQCVVGTITPESLRRCCVPSMMTPAQYDKALQELLDAGTLIPAGGYYVR